MRFSRETDRDLLINLLRRGKGCFLLVLLNGAAGNREVKTEYNVIAAFRERKEARKCTEEQVGGLENDGAFLIVTLCVSLKNARLWIQVGIKVSL